jgi:hypothetical protein
MKYFEHLENLLADSANVGKVVAVVITLALMTFGVYVFLFN